MLVSAYINRDNTWLSILTSANKAGILHAEHMESTVRSFNRLALASFVFGLLSPVIFLVFVVIGALQETGHYVFLESYRYEALARILMLSLSVAAVLLAYRAKFQIAIGNGIYRGATLAHIGRILGYVWGAVMLFAVLRWPL